LKLTENEYRTLFFHYEPFTPMSVVCWAWEDFNNSGQDVGEWTERELNCMAAMLSVYGGVKEKV